MPCVVANCSENVDTVWLLEWEKVDNKYKNISTTFGTQIGGISNF